MLPSLRPETIVIATGIVRTPIVDQVVIVRHDGMDKIKRIQKIKHGRIFVIGDNPRASIDSRSFGWLPQDSIIAKVIWPRV